MFIHMFRRRAALLLLFAALTLQPAAAFSAIYDFTPGSDIFGRSVVLPADPETTLLDVARDNDLGYNEIEAANPGIDPWLPKEGQEVVIPTEWIYPTATREGIVLNMAEMRLFYFRTENGKKTVVTYPIGVGREGFTTPEGIYKVVGKEKDPTWYPPASILAENPGLPKAVPPGPKNPLGRYKIKLSLPGYLLHGTRKPWGVGRRVSHGCVRLYPEDIERLFYQVSPGTRVEIVYRPVKVGLVGGRLMVEVHDDYLAKWELFEDTLNIIRKLGHEDLLDIYALDRALTAKSGIPTDVTAGADETARKGPAPPDPNVTVIH